MKLITTVNITVILCGLFIAPSAVSHPFDSPLTFRKHSSDNGGIVYSNIQKKCFANGVLLCAYLHPVFGVRQTEQPTNERVTPQKTDPKSNIILIDR